MSWEVNWLPTNCLIPPHGVARPEQVRALAEDFVRFGWDFSKPALIGYKWEKKVQLLSGSHRFAAAAQAKIRVPVVLIPYGVVQQAWGNLEDWKALMKTGDAAL